VLYRAARFREFNPFLNASDRLEEFIRFCGEQKVRGDDMLQLPISLFIGWLILRAAEADQEPPPDNVRLLPDLRKVKSPHCAGCGHFLPRELVEKKLNVCSPGCFDRVHARAA
jgi:hypothetical protein